jgi:hypothetical protein
VKYEVCVGVDVCAYGTQTFEADSDEAAIAKAKDILENNMPVLEPEWDTQDKDRIVFVRKGDEENGEWIAENIELCPDPLHDNAYRLLQTLKLVESAFASYEEVVKDGVVLLGIVRATIEAAEGKESARNCDANAELIVRAAHSHEALVKALEAIYNDADRTLDDDNEDGPQLDVWGMLASIRDEAQEALAQVKRKVQAHE